jgi:hypothetical protein
MDEIYVCLNIDFVPLIIKEIWNAITARCRQLSKCLFHDGFKSDK